MAGPAGADFGFQPDPHYWGVEAAGFGGVFRDGQASLDGPGELTSNQVGAGGPSELPGNCSRGGEVRNFYYRLVLPPDTSTFVEIPVTLTASPLDGMYSNLQIRYYPDSITSLSPTVEAPVQIGGKTGVAVRFDAGESIPGYLEANNRQPITLSGSTAPALPNTGILIKATPFLAGSPAPPVRWISVTTDAEGDFSKEVSFGRSAVWRLTAYPQVDDSYGDEPSCGPTLKSTVDTYLATYNDLNNRTFRSESVKGTKLIGQKKITLSFSGGRWVDHDNDTKTPNVLLYNLTGNAGCNTIAGRYWLKDGRLVWSRNLVSTEIGCPKPVDQWLVRTLRKGVKARIVKGKLVLTDGQGLRITLGPA